MWNGYNSALLLAAALSALAALLHVGVIIGGAPWYRFFGAGERMACAAQEGRAYPAVLTSGITVVLAVWAAYALSGAGLLQPLPLRKPVLTFVTGIYLLRGLGLVPALLFARSKVTLFDVWSSLICAALGVAHLIGVAQRWDAL
jgi:hypothetical protein